jgi:hypothetical protein
MAARMEVSSPDLADLALAIRLEENGAVMRRELLRNLRAAVKPAVTEAKSSIMSMPSGGLRQQGGSLRLAIARQVTTEVSLTTKRAKVRVKVRKRNMPRGFVNAPKATQLAKGWRHPVIGTDRWVSQIGKPGWFDHPLGSRRAQYRAAVQAAMQQTANRIARRI